MTDENAVEADNTLSNRFLRIKSNPFKEYFRKKNMYSRPPFRAYYP